MINLNLDTLIVLEDGTSIKGTSIGSHGKKVSEIVFNTSMTGYQEVLTDPSYASQSVVFTYPHIGNTGVNDEDYQSESIFLDAIIVRDFSEYASSYRMKNNLKYLLLHYNIIGISNIDTRMLTRHIRNNGSMLGCISSDSISQEEGLMMIEEYKKSKINLTKIVSTNKIREYTSSDVGCYNSCQQYSSKEKNGKIVVVDFGVKRAILDNVATRFSSVIVVPFDTNAKEIFDLYPDAILLSNGPGDPRNMKTIITEVKKIIKSAIPVLGICLGHQLIALACDGQIKKMKFGHHGSNHPVYFIPNGVVSISSQNHSYCVSKVPPSLDVLSYSLFDNTIQGLKHKKLPVVTFQGHPEGSPGPLDCNFYFDLLVSLVEEKRIYA